MSFFQKLFGYKKDPRPAPAHNTTLLELIRTYHAEQTMENYKPILQELKAGQAELLLPCQEVSDNDNSNIKLANEQMELTSVFDMSGKVVIGAFTSEETLFDWAGKQVTYRKISGAGLLGFCQQRGINRIVIDIEQPTEFILEQRAKPASNKNENVKFKARKPHEPLLGDIAARLQQEFKATSFIQSAYQFEIVQNGKATLNIGFRLDRYNAANRNVCFNIVQSVMEDTRADGSINVLLLDYETLFEAVQQIDGAQIYAR